MVQLSDTRADLGTSSLNRSVTEAPFMHTVRAMPTLAAALVGPLIVTGCSSASRSYPALAKIAHAVPVPSGLTYVNEIDHNNAAMFPGSDKNEVDLVYSNTSLSCEQLTSAWRAALQKAHRQLDVGSESGPGALYLHSGGALVTLDPGGIAGSCPQPRVAVTAQ